MIFTVSQDAACLQWTWQEMQGMPVHHAHTTLPEDDAASVSSAGSSTSSGSTAASASSATGSTPEPELLQPTGAQVQRGALAAQQRREVHAVPDPSAPAYGDMSVGHGTWRCVARHYFNMDHARVHAADLHKASGLLVVGFDSGVFGLYMLPDCSAVHSLSMGRARITSARINASGDWIAFASAPSGALLVWEWQSESYVLKQAGHRQAVQAVAWSPDGSIMASGGDDGKIKLWNTHTGFCYVTFTDHTGPITSLTFMGGAGGRGVALVSASLDGTVRAFDCVRYRNFRTLAAPDMPQFVSVAVDAAGELVAAGGADPFNIYVWSLATGKLLDVLAGHEGPIPCLAFKPDASALASVSWDRTMRVWDVFGSGGTRETFDHPSDVLGVAWRPDGKQIVTASREGALHLWDPERGQGLGSIDVRRDAAGGRRKSTTQTAADDSATKHFSTVAYTSDGQCVLAGGRSKWVALYAVEPRLLLRKWQITHNVSLDGVRDKFNSASIGVLGVDKADIDFGRDEEQEGKGAWSAATLPGAARAAQGHRSTPPEARTRAVALAPTGRAWCAAVPGGVAVYSLDDDMRFDPFELDEDATPASVRTAIVHKEWSKALALALHLGEREPLHWAMTTVPNDALALVAAALPRVFVPRLLHWLGEALASQTAIERSLRWTVAVLTSHAPSLKARSPAILAGLRAVQRGMAASCDKVLELAESNTYQLEFLAVAQAAQGLLASEANKLEVSREATEADAAAHSVVKMRAGMLAGAMFE